MRSLTPAPLMHQTASYPVESVPPHANRRSCRAQCYPRDAKRCHPVPRRADRLADLRDQGVAGSNPVSPTQGRGGTRRIRELRGLPLHPPQFRRKPPMRRSRRRDPGGSATAQEARFTFAPILANPGPLAHRQGVIGAETKDAPVDRCDAEAQPLCDGAHWQEPSRRRYSAGRRSIATWFPDAPPSVRLAGCEFDRKLRAAARTHGG